jgi:hypothetical protein
MSLHLKAATALALATLLSAPALAATAPAITADLSNAAKADMVPIAKLTHIIGVWRSADLKMFDKAKSIKVFDAKMLYQGADLKKLASVESREATRISHIRSAIKGDAGLDAWFTANHVDINRIIAVSTPKGGTPEVILF